MSTTLHAERGTAQMRLLVRDVPSQLVVGTRQAFKHGILDALHAGAQEFVLDFTSTGYVDSSGLGVLFSLSKRIHEHGGRLILCGMNDDLKTLLELTGLDPFFSTADTREQALDVLATDAAAR